MCKRRAFHEFSDRATASREFLYAPAFLIEVRRGLEPTYVLQPDVGFPTNFLGLEAGDFSVGATHH